jgi:arylsulfatase A
VNTGRIPAKGTTKDNGTHAPLIANWPGQIAEAAVSRDLVDFSDMLPTIAEVARISKGHANWSVDGHRFWPTLQSKGGTHQRDYVYCWYHRDGIREQAKQLARTQSFKFYADGRSFDTRNDLKEKKPLNVSNHDGGDLRAYNLLQDKLTPHVAATTQVDRIPNARRNELKRTPAKKNPKKKIAYSCKSSPAAQLR